MEFCCKQIIDEIQKLSNTNNYHFIINSFHDSLLRTRPIKCNHYRYNIQDEFLQKVSELSDANDFSSVYKFLDELSEKDNKFMTSIALERLSQTKNPDGFYLIHEASKNGNLKLVKYLVEYGCDKELRSRSTFTPLIWASRYGKLEVVKYLIFLGADIEAKTNDGRTPLISACYNGHIEVVKYLISIGADKEAKNNDGYTPLIQASINSYLDVVKYLISVGANKDAKDFNGNTCLAYGSYEIRSYISSI